MDIIFMGTPEFAVASLDTLVNSKHNVKAVVSVPDKAAGRGKKIKYSAIKNYAMAHNIPILQPEKLKDPSFLNQLRAYQADLFVVVAFRMLPKEVWQMPAMGTINIHASLLPQYRGAAPINHAIINGETKTGLTTFMIDEKIDTGRIILQKEISILPEDNVGSLHDKLMELSKDIVLDTCSLIENGEAELIPQPDISTLNILPAPKIFKKDCHISTSLTVEKAQRLVRGLSPYPAAFVELVSPEGNTINLKVYQTKINNDNQGEHQIFTDGTSFLSLGFTDGRLLVEELQLQNKKRMKTVDFLRGFKIDSSWRWQ